MEDVAKALVSILNKGKIGDCYHISTESTHSIREIVEICYSQFGHKAEDFIQYSKERAGKDSAYLLDSRKLRKEMSWRDEIDFEQGIMRTKQWIESDLKGILQQQEAYIHRA